MKQSNEHRLAVAIWIQGGIGMGNYSQGYPMAEKLFAGLAVRCDVVVYSETAPDRGFINRSFSLKSPPRWLKSRKLRWLFLSLMLLLDHISGKRYQRIVAFWGYPAGFFAVILGKLLRIKSVISLLGADSASIPSIRYGVFQNPSQRRIAEWSYRHASGILTISDFQKNKLRSFGIHRPITTIPWGADGNMYKFTKKPKASPVRFIHVGHINPVKDQTTLLKAFQIISAQVPARLKIFGLDTLDGVMHKLAKELCIDQHVRFEHMVPYGDMPQHFQEADIMLHTSLSEGQCMALTEAAASGVLMAGTNVGILHDLGPECGVIVEPGEYQLLAEKVLEIIHDPAEWDRRVANARTWSAAHDLNWTVHSIHEYLNSV